MSDDVRIPDIGRAQWQLEYRDETQEIRGRGLQLRIKNGESGRVTILKVGKPWEMALACSPSAPMAQI